MNRKVLIYFNPSSGTKKTNNVVSQLSSRLDELEISYQKQASQGYSPNHIIVGTANSEEFSEMIVVGGDGTLNEAVNGLKADIPVGVVTTGTGNDYSKALSLPSAIRDQIEIAISGNEARVDVGVCNDRKFLNGVGIGFDGQIVADMLNRNIPLLTGQAKYYYHVLQILSSYRERKFTIEMDQSPVEKELILMTIAKGTTFGGGFILTPHAHLDDGKLAICSIGKFPSISRWLNIHRLQKGTHDKLKQVDFLKAESIKIQENSLLEGHVDGEYLGKPPFEISVEKQALTVRK